MIINRNRLSTKLLIVEIKKVYMTRYALTNELNGFNTKQQNINQIKSDIIVNKMKTS